MPPRHLPLRIVAVTILFASLSGCVNLDDAAGLSKLADQARIALPRVSNDVAGTCARQNALFENARLQSAPQLNKRRIANPTSK